MAQYEEFTVDQGADVAIELHLTDLDGAAKNLNGHTVTAKLKKTFNSDSADTTEFNTVVASPATDGKVTLSLTNTQTDALKAGRYVYDIIIDNGTTRTKVLEGQLHVEDSVTFDSP